MSNNEDENYIDPRASQEKTMTSHVSRDDKIFAVAVTEVVTTNYFVKAATADQAESLAGERIADRKPEVGEVVRLDREFETQLSNDADRAGSPLIAAGGESPITERAANDDDQFVFADSANLFPEVVRSPAKLHTKLTDYVDGLNQGDIVNVWQWSGENSDCPLVPLVLSQTPDGWCVHSADRSVTYASGINPKVDV